MTDYEGLEKPPPRELPLDNDWIVRRKEATQWNPVNDVDMVLSPGVANRAYLSRTREDAAPIHADLTIENLTERAPGDLWGLIEGDKLRTHLASGEIVFEIVEIGLPGDYRDSASLLVVETATPEYPTA